MRLIETRIPKNYLGAIDYDRTVGYVDFAEFTFKSALQKNGYRVTIAAIVSPTLKHAIFGASACSPEDAFNFSRIDAANRSLGRARAQAFRALAGLELQESLITPYERVMIPIAHGLLENEDKLAFELKNIASGLFGIVAFNAQTRAIIKDFSIFQHMHEDMDVLAVLTAERGMLPITPQRVPCWLNKRSLGNSI